MTYIGVPLIVTGIIIQERDRGFRYLRNDYIAVCPRSVDAGSESRWCQGPQLVGTNVGERCLFGGIDGRSGEYLEIHL